jgi:hypothetical protein
MSDRQQLLINQQANLVDFLQREKGKLEKENFLLKSTIRASMSFMKFNIPPEINLETEPEQKESWAEKSERFGAIRSQLLTVAVRLVKAEGKAVHQDRIINAFAVQYANVFRLIKSPGETLARRLRELREDGWLISPADGYYFIGPKAVEETVSPTT